MSLKGGAFRNTFPNVSLTRAKTTWEHPESTGPSKKNGIAGQEPPEALTEVVDGEFHEPSDPEVPPSSGEKGPQNSQHLASLEMVTNAGVPAQTSFYPYCI